MEQPSAFEFPARQSSPLRTLSPERVNSRPSPTVGGSSSRKTSENEYESPSARATHSPSSTRKANLFADYHPKTRSSSPSKEVFGGGSGVPQSPSLPEFPMLRTHGRTNSDVQGLVKRFEHLDVRDRDAESESRRKKQEMELRRAQLGREEAESELSKWKEECRRIAEDLKESRHRESKVSNRLEKVMDDFRQAKGEYSTNSEAYVKEVRKARKEAFKSSSAVLKLQETLRDTQKRLQVSKIDHATDVQKAGRFEQEATDSKCELIAMQQEYSKLQEQYRILEQEKEALKINLKEEEVARIAAEGQIPLPAGRDDDEDLFDSPRKASPRKNQRSPLSDDKENVGIVTKKMAESKRLQEEVDMERRRRESAEEMVEFLRMECAFKCCDCSSASRHGRALRVSMDDIVASSIAKMKADIATILTPPASENGEDKMDVEGHMLEPEAMEPSSDIPEQKESEREVDEVMTEDYNDTPAQEDESVTLAADETSVSAEEEVIQAPRPTPAHVASNDEHADTQDEVVTEGQAEHQNEDSEAPEASETNTTVTVPLKDSPPSTPPRAQHNADFDNQHPHSVRTITTTTRIPMHFTPVSKPAPVPFSEQENFRPLTDNTSDCAIDDAPSALPFDREAALAAIAYRRGRAKSIADGTMTPRKQMIEGVSINGRRDISAPVIGANGYHRKANSVSRSTGRALRT